MVSRSGPTLQKRYDQWGRHPWGYMVLKHAILGCDDCARLEYLSQDAALGC
jgi:hypothetical protein